MFALFRPRLSPSMYLDIVNSKRWPLKEALRKRSALFFAFSQSLAPLFFFMFEWAGRGGCHTCLPFPFDGVVGEARKKRRGFRPTFWFCFVFCFGPFSVLQLRSRDLDGRAVRAWLHLPVRIEPEIQLVLGAARIGHILQQHGIRIL